MELEFRLCLTGALQPGRLMNVAVSEKAILFYGKLARCLSHRGHSVKWRRLALQSLGVTGCRQVLVPNARLG